MEKLSRRTFFKLAGGGIAAAIAAPHALAAKVTQIPVEFGFTWYTGYNTITGEKVTSEFSKIITETLRNNSNMLRDNISKNNVLLAKLKDGHKVQLNIERISEEEQTRRMIMRLEERAAEKQQQRIRDKPKNNGKMYEPGGDPIEWDTHPLYEGR